MDMNKIDLNGVKNPDSYYAIYYEDKVVDNVFHRWEEMEYEFLDDAKRYLKMEKETESAKGWNLCLFKVIVEKIDILEETV